MKIYLAGPMRGLPEFNFPAFVEATAELRSQGHEVFNPAERDLATGFDPSGLSGSDEELATLDFDLRAALGADTEFICQEADAVALLPGWENSTGAVAERSLAEALGLRIIHLGDSLRLDRKIRDVIQGEVFRVAAEISDI